MLNTVRAVVCRAVHGPDRRPRLLLRRSRPGRAGPPLGPHSSMGRVGAYSPRLLILEQCGSPTKGPQSSQR
jgi:hypothetical protein